MKNKNLVISLLAAAFLCSGCATITRPAGGGAEFSSKSATGEAWYVKNRRFIILLSSDVYPCDGKGTCQRAEIR